jgi:hypothetical protein
LGVRLASAHATYASRRPPAAHEASAARPAPSCAAAPSKADSALKHSKNGRDASRHAGGTRGKKDGRRSAEEDEEEGGDEDEDEDEEDEEGGIAAEMAAEEMEAASASRKSVRGAGGVRARATRRRVETAMQAERRGVTAEESSGAASKR